MSEAHNVLVNRPFSLVGLLVFRTPSIAAPVEVQKYARNSFIQWGHIRAVGIFCPHNPVNYQS